MPSSTRAAASVALAVAAFCAFPARAEAIISHFQPQFPEVFAPANSYAYPVRVRAWSIFGAPNTWTQDVRIEVSCGVFEGYGPSIVMRPDTEGWLLLPVYRAGADPQECSMTFVEVEGTASLTLPLHVYDPAAVIVTPDLSGGIATEAKRPFSFVLGFHTAAGQAIMNNEVVVFPDGTQGASAEVDNLFFRMTDIDGNRVVNGTANNASGDYVLIVELQNIYRWFIPVRQKSAPPGHK